ncbi:MAG TPA: PaaI family thioesterase [Acidimicrobiia bacterium]|nr:PaaI family thioesterase [Acidimicrobiia bacterium]
MAIEPLLASRFGFDSRCFVCEPANPRGLQVPFFHDTDAQVVFATFDLPPEFSGAPTLVHGGVTLALIDEAMSWATIALGGKFAYTGETSTRFEWPVRLGRSYRVEGRLVDRADRQMTTAAAVLDGKGRTCVRATATMVVLDLDQAADAIGTDLAQDDTKYTR